jgi:hypothetical protein
MTFTGKDVLSNPGEKRGVEAGLVWLGVGMGETPKLGHAAEQRGCRLKFSFAVRGWNGWGGDPGSYP